MARSGDGQWCMRQARGDGQIWRWPEDEASSSQERKAGGSIFLEECERCATPIAAGIGSHCPNCVLEVRRKQRATEALALEALAAVAPHAGGPAYLGLGKRLSEAAASSTSLVDNQRRSWCVKAACSRRKTTCSMLSGHSSMCLCGTHSAERASRKKTAERTAARALEDLRIAAEDTAQEIEARRKIKYLAAAAQAAATANLVEQLAAMRQRATDERLAMMERALAAKTSPRQSHCPEAGPTRPSALSTRARGKCRGGYR